MTRRYWNNLREHVVLAVEPGGNCRAVAKDFGVPVYLAVKGSQRHQATGSFVPGRTVITASLLNLIGRLSSPRSPTR